MYYPTNQKTPFIAISSGTNTDNLNIIENTLKNKLVSKEEFSKDGALKVYFD
jgi:hypothetical protein